MLLLLLAFKGKIFSINIDFYNNNNNIIKEYNSEKLNLFYDKLINIKRILILFK